MLKEMNIEGLDTNKVMISVTHTHTSHACWAEHPKGATSIVDKYLPEDKRPVVERPEGVMDEVEAGIFVSTRAAEAIAEAWKNRTDAYYANEFGRAVVGHCRRVVYDDATAKMYGDTHLANFYDMEAGSDSGVELLYFFNAEKQLTGVAVNIACPSQVVEHRSFVSSDYWGKVKILLREKFGENIYVLGLCGAAGDQAPRDMIRFVNPENPIDDPQIHRDVKVARKADPNMFEIEGTWELGKRIANVICDKYEAAVEEMHDAEVLKHAYTSIDFPLRKVTLTERDHAQEILDDYLRNSDKKNFDASDRAKLYLYCGIISRYELQQKSSVAPGEVHVLRLDNIAFGTNPFELFQNFGNRIKALSDAEQTFIIQLCCGRGGYLPTKEAERGGHYSAYVTSGTTDHTGGEMLVNKTLTLIRALFKD